MKKNIMLIGLFTILTVPLTEITAISMEENSGNASTNLIESKSINSFADKNEKNISTIENEDNGKEQFKNSVESSTLKKTPETTDNDENEPSSDSNSNTTNQTVSSSDYFSEGNQQKKDPTINFRSNYNELRNNSAISYNPISAPWTGGNINIHSNSYNKHFSDIVRNNYIIYNNLVFSMVFDLPEGMSPQSFIESITSDSYLEFGAYKWMIPTMVKKTLNIGKNKNNFSIENGKVVYHMTIDEWKLLFPLISSIVEKFLQSDLWLDLNLNLDINKLSQSFAYDHSKDKIVSTDHLLPNKNKKLTFGIKFIGWDETNPIKDDTSSVNTWNTYISPWNKEEASNNLNGKDDDTQDDHTQEVLGETRVLKGDNYKNRTVSLPINQNPEPNKYIRVVNPFSKKAEIGDNAGTITFKQRSDSPKKTQYEGKNGEQILEKTTTYTYQGQDNHGQALSPVSINFSQKTILDLSVTSNKKNVGINQPITFNGILTSEGKNNQFYYQLQNGPRIKIKEVALTGDKQVRLTIPGLPKEGDYDVIISVTNEYGLEKKVSIKIHVANPKIEFHSVTGTLDFGNREKIPNPGDKIYAKNPFSIQVSDTFSRKKEWKVLARIKDPFQTAGKEELPGTLYIHKKNKMPIALTDTPTLLYENDKINQGVISVVDFKESNLSQGLFLKIINSNVKTNSAYKGTIEFEIQKGP